MGSWAYCRTCGSSIGPPTVREALSMRITCSCGEVRELDEWDREHYGLSALEERLEELEKKCETLQKLVDTLLARR